MKYLILMYGSQKDFDLMSSRPYEEFAPLHDFMESLEKELVDSGEFVDTRGLDAPVHTRRVSLRDGAPVVTDGPYAETQEVLAGYWVLDCVSFDRATQIAAKIAACPNPGDVFTDPYVDVRPFADMPPGLEL